MLLDNANPYVDPYPENLTLGLDDFTFEISPANDKAIGQTAEWSVICYMAADCNLAALMFDDLYELKQVGSNDTVHLSAFFCGPLLTDSFFARLNPEGALAEDIVVKYLQVDRKSVV